MSWEEKFGREVGYEKARRVKHAFLIVAHRLSRLTTDNYYVDENFTVPQLGVLSDGLRASLKPSTPELERMAWKMLKKMLKNGFAEASWKPIVEPDKISVRSPIIVNIRDVEELYTPLQGLYEDIPEWEEKIAKYRLGPLRPKIPYIIELVELVGNAARRSEEKHHITLDDVLHDLHLGFSSTYTVNKATEEEIAENILKRAVATMEAWKLFWRGANESNKRWAGSADFPSSEVHPKKGTPPIQKIWFKRKPPVAYLRHFYSETLVFPV